MQNNFHEEWYRKALEDELSIRAILKEGGHPSTVCFLAQQMAEKYLKGLVVFYDLPLQKIHDLLQLETVLNSRLPDIKELHDGLGVLNRYYIETRYPGDYPEFFIDEAREALQYALVVKDYVLKRSIDI